MTRSIKLTLLTFVIFILEYGLCKHIAIGGAVPMLTFCYVILAAMYEKNKESAVILAILTGALCDLAGGHGFGTYTLVYGIIAFGTSVFCDSILSSKFLFLIINTFIMTIFAECVYFLFHIIAIGTGAFWQCLTAIILPTAVYNVVISALLYKPMKYVFERR